MTEFSRGDNRIAEREQQEKWDIQQIRAAVEDDDLDAAMKELKLSWLRGHQVTKNYSDESELGVQVKTGLAILLKEFILENIMDNKLSVKERINYYRFIYPYDYAIARTFIEYLHHEEANQEYEDSIVNPPELKENQFEYYEWCIKNNEGINAIYEALIYDGHLNDRATYPMEKSMKKKILDYVKKRHEISDRITKDREKISYDEIVATFDEEAM